VASSSGPSIDDAVASDRDQRNDPRRVYEEVIKAAPQRKLGQHWPEFRDRWTARLAQSQDQKVAARPAKGKSTTEFSVEDEALQSPSEEAVRQAVEVRISTRPDCQGGERRSTH
jgi:hypothetical protein